MNATNWFFLAAFIVQTVFACVALDQRDEARKAGKVEMNGNTVVLVCGQEKRP